MSSDALKEIIDAGNHLTALRYYRIATTTVFFYDFFLTLSDEIKYAWHGRKSWVFVIFIANRYLPIGYQLWSLYVSYNSTFHQRTLVSTETVSVAQVVITLRIYAVTGKNRTITSCFVVIMISQFVLGLYMIAYAATRGAEPIIPVSLPVYMICLAVQSRSLEIGLTVICLVYDFLAFLVFVYLVVRSNVYKVPIPSLLRTIVRDATYYFLFIFTSHLVVVLFLLFASPRIRLLPVSGTIVFLPVMVTRLMLSLKKAATSQDNGWSLGESTTHSTTRFAERRGGVFTRDEIRLDTFVSTYEEIQSREW